MIWSTLKMIDIRQKKGKRFSNSKILKAINLHIFSVKLLMENNNKKIKVLIGVSSGLSVIKNISNLKTNHSEQRTVQSKYSEKL